MELIWFLSFSFVGGLGALCIFLAFLKKGQFEDVEETKYQMFRDEKED